MFIRYGYRKTSMDEVARAAQVSRQGLYLHFANKEDLFRAAVKHALESSLQAASRRLRDTSAAAGAEAGARVRRVGGPVRGHAWGGAPPTWPRPPATLVGPLFAEHETPFAELVAKAIGASGLAAAYKPAGLTARQLADTLSRHRARPEAQQRLARGLRGAA